MCVALSLRGSMLLLGLSFFVVTIGCIGSSIASRVTLSRETLKLTYRRHGVLSVISLQEGVCYMSKVLNISSVLPAKPV